jgi:hypothetical protein
MLANEREHSIGGAQCVLFVPIAVLPPLQALVFNAEYAGAFLKMCT